MSLIKVNYIDGETVIGAENLNAIQEAILENEDHFTDLEVLFGTTDPTTSTVGAVGQFYINTATNKLFNCIAVSPYTWVSVGGGGGSSGGGSYIFIKYADNQPTSDSDMKTTISAWIGVYVGEDEEAPQHYTSYQWYQIKGAKGDTGSQGASGDDGFSPIITITTISGGHRVTITDAEGSHYFEVMDGSGSGDMQAETYDPTSAVANAGGIVDYVQSVLPTVPTNVSAFTNDAGYLTQHQSLSAYRTASAQDTIDATKLDKTQGVAHSGEFLVVGSDGNITTRTLSAWEGGSY